MNGDSRKKPAIVGLVAHHRNRGERREPAEGVRERPRVNLQVEAESVAATDAAMLASPQARSTDPLPAEYRLAFACSRTADPES